MVIRDIRPGEGVLVAKLAAESPTAAHWAAADYEAVAAGRSPNEFCLVAEQEPGGAGILASQLPQAGIPVPLCAICGFLHASIVVGEAELLNVVVASSERRRGVAGALLDQARGRLRERGATLLWLEVRESNAAAVAFYRALGFEQRSRRKAYYRDPVEDALVFSLDFFPLTTA
jgi:ribosomal protein S18 acetylase RimI-like enzyme